MKRYLERLPPDFRELVYFTRDLTAYRDMRAYLVGGFVRDLILGVRNFDMDIAIVGDGIRFAEYFSSHLKARIIRHRRFGTATVVLRNNLKIDVSTARSEVYPEPGHLPVVKSGTLKDDLFRRDFTINAMAISICGNDFGKLIDFFGGREDLRNRRIRVLHDLSFIDDPTRILRGVRFEQRYDFRIEPKTLKLLKEAVKLKMLERVQPQRIRDDLILVLKEAAPIREISRIRQLCGFTFIDKHLKVDAKTFALMRSVRNVLKWFRQAHPDRRLIDTWLIYFMALTDGLGPDTLRLISRRLALRKGEEKRILDCKNIQATLPRALRRKDILHSQIFNCLEPLSYEVILLLKAKYYKDPLVNRHIDDFFVHLNGVRIHTSGDDLRRLGLTPGPHYHRIFKELLEARLDGKISSREEELRFARGIIKNSRK